MSGRKFSDIIKQAKPVTDIKSPQLMGDMDRVLRLSREKKNLVNDDPQKITITREEIPQKNIVKENFFETGSQGTQPKDPPSLNTIFQRETSDSSSLRPRLKEDLRPRSNMEPRLKKNLSNNLDLSNNEKTDHLSTDEKRMIAFLEKVLVANRNEEVVISRKEFSTKANVNFSRFYNTRKCLEDKGLISFREDETNGISRVFYSLK